MPKRSLERGRDALEVGCQQTPFEVPRRLAALPRHRRLVVGADEQAMALLTGVDLATEVNGAHELVAGALVVGDDVIERLGDHVGVLHGEHRQFHTHHAAHLAGPQPASVHHVGRFNPLIAAVVAGGIPVTGEVAGGRVVQADAPGTVGRSLDAASPGVAADLGSGCGRRPGVGKGHATGIDVTVFGIEHRTHELVGVDDGQQPGSFVDRDHF